MCFFYVSVCNRNRYYTSHLSRCSRYSCCNLIIIWLTFFFVVASFTFRFFFFYNNNITNLIIDIIIISANQLICTFIFIHLYIFVPFLFISSAPNILASGWDVCKHYEWVFLSTIPTPIMLHSSCVLPSSMSVGNRKTGPKTSARKRTISPQFPSLTGLF